jgi:predicted nucleotidyltransferase
MLDLSPIQLAEVRRILAYDVPDCRVLAFGSRVTGGSMPYSDLDLAVVGPARLPDNILVHLKDMFAISDLPFSVDVLDWHRIPADFREIILRDGVQIYPEPMDA